MPNVASPNHSILVGAFASAVALLIGISGCSDLHEPLVESIAEWPSLECDPLVPSYCAFPFPSNVFTVSDARTATGRRLNLHNGLMPEARSGEHASPAPWNKLDGFSGGMTIMAHFPELTEASLDNVATARSIADSVAVDSPTVLLDAETGARVPHWVELDAVGDDPSTRALLIRPAVRLEDSRRYIVAIGGLKDANGTVFPATQAFAELRDQLESSEPTVIERRRLYANILRVLKVAQVETSELQLAWDFSTASRQNNTGALLHMRDEALALVGPGGPEFEITAVDENYRPEYIAYRLEGEMRVPLYLTKVGPGGVLTLGGDGLPHPNPEQAWARFAFEILIPSVARNEPAALLQYGHGLLGDKEQIESEHLLEFINAYNYVLFAVDFVGMSSEDEVFLANAVASGRFDQFANAVDRQHQGMLNSLLAMRMMKTGFAADPEFGKFVDSTQAYYYGISQGGIFGGTYMALSTDVIRGALGVMGMPYQLLLSRSVDFDVFFEIIAATFEDRRDQALLLSLAQLQWDRTEPNGYAPYIVQDPLPGTLAKQVLMRAALGDHQVTNYGAHVMARSMGVAHVETGLSKIFGMETQAAPYQGSALVEYDFGLPADPLQNLPQRECEDPHGKLRGLQEARQQLDVFLRTGVVENFCAQGTCNFSELSGCGE